MYLKKLEMLGFKSFADKTELVFKPGMTAIVGPNGCGKSNVVDAFKWIFGEQSAKGMRGSEMKDVIFNGTMERKPTGFADVTIVFENSDRFLDVDYSEVAITRRLFRSGESEYLINKQRCRLKDIKELFMGTGVGQTSYSILEQGKIDALLQANNVERRFIFEEAAGISRYLSKKAESLRALLRVEENLTRLNDIIAEVEKRLQRVKAQASKARRYRELSERLKDLRIRCAIEDYRESVHVRSEVSFRLHWIAFQQERLESALSLLGDNVRKTEAQRAAHDDRLRELREAVATVQLQAERGHERMEQERRRSSELLEERDRKSAEIEANAAAVEQLAERIAGEKAEVEALAADTGRRRGRCQELQAALDEARRRRERVEGDLRGKKGDLVALLQERARLSNTIVQIDSESANLRAQLERLRGGMETLFGQAKAESEREAALSSNISELAARCKSLEQDRRGREEALELAQGALAELEAELGAKSERIVERRSRHEVLSRLEQSFEGISQSVAGILRDRESIPALARVRGLLGMVGSMVKVEAKYARAVEAALGPRAQSLVVECQDGALELLDFAREGNVGALEVVSLDRVDSVPEEHFPRQAGVLGSLHDKVQVSEDLEELFARLLANVVLVEDLDTALALSRNGLRPFRLVTLAGDMIEPWGSISIPGSAELGVISRRSEMDELLEEVESLGREEGALKERQATQRRGLVEARHAVGRLREEEQEVEKSIALEEGAMAHCARERDRLAREVAVSQAEAAEIEEGLKSRVEEKTARESEAAKLDASRQVAEERIATLESEALACAQADAQASETLTQGRLELAQAEKRAEGLQEMVAREEANLAERKTRSEDLRAAVNALVERHRESQEALAANDAELVRVAALELEARAGLDAAEREAGGIREAEQKLREAMDAVRAEAGRLQKERESAHLRDQEEKHKRNAIVERMDEEYGLDLKQMLESELPAPAPVAPSPAIAAPPSAEVASAQGEAESATLVEPAVTPKDPPPSYLSTAADWDREKARDEIREIQERLRKLGNVNLEALDELEELEERHKFQAAQRDDLLASARSLQGIIAEINKTSREMFLKTFAEVQTHFSDLFRKCFEGGKAELVLEEGQDVLEAGIDIVAKPPGKKITTLSLMSGGEKTMTTIALLFAIFRAKPGPFCILDEVDAPLDETNVRRFVVLLKDFIAQTQFIVVTHNKVTMGEAQSLYGITMQEHGVSKRVSVELESYDPERLEAGVS
ncbi:MAG TPA: chromosome segregation protein SMC [Planctomycetota bacterium]|nr:chromosome segregation protein SMC [Planctomycetota bacterium]